MIHDGNGLFSADAKRSQMASLEGWKDWFAA
jgi:hypothetical protein